MKKSIVIVTLFTCFVACKNKPAVIKQNEKAVYKLGDLPNKDTKYDTLVGNSDTSAVSKDMSELMTILLKDKFTVTINKQLITPLSIELFRENKIIIFKDVSTLKLFAHSIISEKRMKNTFADFTVYEMNFKNEQDAEMVVEWYNEARKQFRTEKIDVDKILSKKNKVYYLTTRAEMFRNYIDEYAYFIKIN